MVAGGFGHLRLAETLFGGVTRDLLTSAPCPIFMAHWAKREADMHVDPKDIRHLGRQSVCTGRFWLERLDQQGPLWRAPWRRGWDSNSA